MKRYWEEWGDYMIPSVDIVRSDGPIRVVSDEKHPDFERSPLGFWQQRQARPASCRPRVYASIPESRHRVWVAECCSEAYVRLTHHAALEMALRHVAEHARTERDEHGPFGGAPTE